MRIKSPLLALLTASTLLLQACGGSEAPAASTQTEPAAGITTSPAAPATADATTAMYSDLDGNPVDIANYAGKKVFVNYWATWCAPCIKEIPSITRAEETLGDDYVFLLASDESIETIKEFLLDREFTGKFIKLNGYVGAIGINVMPTSVMYNEDGEQIKSWEGSFEWDSAEMLAELTGE